MRRGHHEWNDDHEERITPKVVSLGSTRGGLSAGFATVSVQKLEGICVMQHIPVSDDRAAYILLSRESLRDECGHTTERNAGTACAISRFDICRESENVTNAVEATDERSYREGTHC